MASSPAGFSYADEHLFTDVVFAANGVGHWFRGDAVVTFDAAAGEYRVVGVEGDLTGQHLVRYVFPA